MKVKVLKVFFSKKLECAARLPPAASTSLRFTQNTVILTLGCTHRYAYTVAGALEYVYIHTHRCNHLFMHAGFGGVSRGFSVFLQRLYK